VNVKIAYQLLSILQENWGKNLNPDIEAISHFNKSMKQQLIVAITLEKQGIIIYIHIHTHSSVTQQFYFGAYTQKILACMCVLRDRPKNIHDGSVHNDKKKKKKKQPQFSL
jgi:hypothetical protein